MNNPTAPNMAFTILPDAPQELNKNGALNKYLILIEGEWIDNQQIYRWYDIVEGRQTAYDYIRELLKGYADENEIFIDIDKSIVISDPPAHLITPDTPRISLTNAFSIYRFMFEMRSRGMVNDDTDFSIDDYKVEESVDSSDINTED